MISVSTLATCAASAFLFFSNTDTPLVSAEEVVSSMEELITTLDSDDDLRMIYEGTAEEAMPDWRKYLDRWPAGDGKDLQVLLETGHFRDFRERQLRHSR
jgi:hypothetical protein